MAKFAEDDRIEQMNAQKRRMKQVEHKRAVDVLLEERRRQMAVDKVCSHRIVDIINLIYLFSNVKLMNVLKLNVLNKFVKKLLKKNVLNYFVNMLIVYWDTYQRYEKQCAIRVTENHIVCFLFYLGCYSR